MKINIDDLSEAELVALNHKIVERLKFLEAYRSHHEMMRFTPGDKVSFEAPGRERQFGTLMKFNKKTVTVLTDTGQRWNVSPHFLREVRDVDAQKNTGNNVVKLPSPEDRR